MKLCIAEKPSVAKEIASILGANQRKDGYYEGNGYWVSWTFGHLCTLKEPHDYTSLWKWWNLDYLPMIPSSFGIKVIDNQGVQKQFRTIENLVQRCEEVINCGDAGQEGELIQQWVLLKAKNTKPIKRLWISSLTEEAIKEGFENLRDGKAFMNLYAAGSSRAIGDWLLGMNATRLYTLKYGREKQVLSIGRVQTPTLAMIVERQKIIDNFKPETYWELKTIYRDVLFSSNIGKIKSKDKGVKGIEYIQGKDFIIDNYEQKEGKEHPPRLFDLTSLQVDANNKFNFSADHTLKLVQSLYEKKLVTYPRVDTTFLPDDIYPKIPKIMDGLTFFTKFTEPLKGKPYRKSKKVFNNKKVTDHHAIIPTGIPMSGVTPDEQKIYNTITKRFISVFYPDCIVSNTTVIGYVDGTNKEKLSFKATGKQIIDPAWRVIYASEKNDQKKKEDNIMPTFEKGEKGPHQPQLQEKVTTPPKYFTEATLLRAMETAGKLVDDDDLRDAMKENGIGRPSTRANIIETLFRRKYIEKKRKNIHATTTGIDLIDTIQSDLLKSAELTGQWEHKLRLIEKGEYDVKQFKKELIEMIVEITNNVKYAQPKKIAVASTTVKEKKKRAPKQEIIIEELICPKCKDGHFIKGKTAYGCSNFKAGCKVILPFKYMGKKLTPKQLLDLIQKGKTTKIKGFVDPNTSQKFEATLMLNQNFEIEKM
ncbi:MAG TPA: type IA DNA topoisomerase [Crocinitomix sp.]|nr:type IA DNA topoisomerase [Crocinitomix sp.]